MYFSYDFKRKEAKKSLSQYIKAQKDYMDYEKHRKQDFYFLDILTDSQQIGVSAIPNMTEEKRLECSEGYLCSIIEYIKSIKDLSKRRKTLNCQYESYDSATPMMIVVQFQEYFDVSRCLAEILEFMIKNGADIRLKDKHELTIFDYLAKYSTNEDAIKIVKKEENRLRKLGLNESIKSKKKCIKKFKGSGSQYLSVSGISKNLINHPQRGRDRALADTFIDNITPWATEDNRRNVLSPCYPFNPICFQPKPLASDSASKIC
ncbi:unnamed protein product [Moneuplotes crassus]|uniref:Uncharacterized protein n=1 Tax=Euplotes crassus TaxID=5936 RepID=A0AAD1U0V3_EUPCR|nr:unnamed protein product [Moneuplotes crassus]